MLQHIFKFLFRPLKTEYLIILLGMKTVVMILTVSWLLVVANAIAVAAQQQQQQPQPQPQPLTYKQQLQYQMQQHDKFQYQQHIRQQQQYYQQQHQQLPISMASEQQQLQRMHQHQQQQQQQQYFPARPTQMLQTAESLLVDDGSQVETFALDETAYSNGNGQKRRPGIRKRKRRPQSSTVETLNNPTASNSPSYWRGQVEDDKDFTNAQMQNLSTKNKEIEEVLKPSFLGSFKRRKQPSARQPVAVLEQEQKVYEMRNQAEMLSTADGSTNSNSANLKNILKNSGGLSLSEILQEKNLSLDDLLKGKHNALQALQTTATEPQEKVPHAKYPSFKVSFKPNPSNVKLAEENSEETHSSKDKSRLSALQRLKLFGTSSRPAGSQVSLADNLTTRKPYATSTTTTTTTKPSTTKIPLYKKILHQRPTLKPTFLLKNASIITSAEPQRVVTSWDSAEVGDVESEKQKKVEANSAEEDDDIELIENEENFHHDVQEIRTDLSDFSNWKMDTTMPPITTPYPTTTSTTSTSKPTTEKSMNIDRSTSTRRMFTSTRGSGRTAYRYSSSTSNPAATSTTSTTSTTTSTTPPPTTTSTTTSTTTASSSTMNLTPKANLNLNTDDLRERIQETLLKNLIEKDDSYKKPPLLETNENEKEDDDDLENFFEETVKPKNTKYFETSTITTRMKQYTPSFIHTGLTSSTSSPAIFTTPTDNSNIIADFDNVDDRTDLLELIEDRRSGNRLFKVLEQRNMTLEELIEHRKRGSSQLHLATIVESPSRFYPDKKLVLQDNMDIVTAFENFPHFNLLNLKSVKPDEIKTDSQGSSYFTSIIDIEPTDEVYKNRKEGKAISEDLDKASLLADRSEKSLGFFPSWKTLALAPLGTSESHEEDASTKRNNHVNTYFLQQPKMLLENNSNNNENNDDLYDIKENELSIVNRHDNNNSEDDYQAQNPIQAAVRLPDRTAEAIENEVARAHDLVDLELSGHGFKRSPQAADALAQSHRRGSFYTNMPTGIKSAIVASATIVLTALATFMVLFAVCKWKQRRHRMTNIMKSYNAMKSKLPTIATTSTGALNTANSTSPNSRRSSFREMQELLGGSGLSVAATITTTSTGVPNTPIHTTKTSSNPLYASQATTALANPCSRNINSIYSHSSKSSKSSASNSNTNCGSRPLQRQSSLLFQQSFNQNSNSHKEKPANLSLLSGCNLLDLKHNNKINGSTTSLSFSLTSGHNISNSHINTMDANSPEVQEYLFDTLRNSF